MEGHTMLHNDYFADDATQVSNFRCRYRMSKGLFMNILHDVREFDPYFKLKHDVAPSGQKNSYFAARQEACRKDVDARVLQAQFAIVRYPALSWSHDQMWVVIHACVMMQNMIIEDDRKNDARTHVGPYECQDPLAEVDHDLYADFTDFLTMHVEILDSNVHDQLQTDLVEHIWMIKGLSANAAAP
ncbi:hypothetical protein QYE76_070005 [Lolium multiflorum]|uniref:Uncharacterized protein n=1 Tax=Lolium multiflorum TaxID=4521 RepID=A0AAD8SJT2_LOLMU|nr:hypothetical protein QYE76_070005 [Lolium multiflorum]